ncbi:MAG TPA: acyl-CoA dehydrogenase [Bacteroidales bacterium]|nr:acyl-CoA dehydrogenase [Bacteroidales bacterium]
MSERKLLRSGEFLVNEIDANDIFIPEEFNEEQRMIAQTCRDFMEAEVLPRLNDIDKGDRELMRSILQKSGELGMLGIAVPEQYSGFGQNFVTQMLVAETTGAGFSFSVAYMCHCGIGTMPILYYGNEEQRLKYVSRLATGELIGSYCLTEPGAGSDANSGKTTAKLSEDGKYYILNGQKMWITNAGFADTQVVFAKVDNDRVLSAFIVESKWPGVVIGPDEHKMGIKGSSTAQVYYNDVRVPVENMLGNRGEGFRIALNILHMGRMKLGANVIGAAKETINQSVQYANERKQFNTKIANFGAIKHKLAEMVIRTYAHESAIYRVSQDIDDLIEKYKAEGCEYGRAAIDAISHYAVEDAILKVNGSEMLDFVVDEGVQIHGGMGYSAEMNVERGYRDSRINRIFEGTNEINRLLVVDTAIKRSLKGDYDLMGSAEQLYNSLDSIVADAGSSDYYDQKMQTIRNFKKVALLGIFGANRAFGKQFATEQEVQNNLSNIIMDLYVAESLALRVKKLESKGHQNINIYKDVVDVFVYDAASRIHKNATDAANSFAAEPELSMLTATIDRLCKVPSVNVKDARRRIADNLIADNEYKF